MRGNEPLHRNKQESITKKNIDALRGGGNYKRNPCVKLAKRRSVIIDVGWKEGYKCALRKGGMVVAPAVVRWGRERGARSRFEQGKTASWQHKDRQGGAATEEIGAKGDHDLNPQIKTPRAEH